MKKVTPVPNAVSALKQKLDICNQKELKLLLAKNRSSFR